MKKLLILLLVSISIVLVGCVNSDFTLDIDKKGNETLYAKILTDDYITEKISKEALSTIKDKFKADKLEEISEDNQKGYLLTKKLGNIKDVKSSENKDKVSNEYIDIQKENNLIFDTYNVNVKIKDAFLGELKEESLGIIDFLGQSAHINFHIVTPFKLLESNATNVYKQEDNRINYSWNYSLDELENIHVKFRVPNIKSIIIIGVGIILLIAIFIFLKRKNK